MTVLIIFKYTFYHLVLSISASHSFLLSSPFKRRMLQLIKMIILDKYELKITEDFCTTFFARFFISSIRVGVYDLRGSWGKCQVIIVGVPVVCFWKI
jgi:hypothetical protein